MKKFLLFSLFVLAGGIAVAQQLSYRFANPRLIRLSGADYFEFDVQAKCSQAGTYLWASTLKLNFNNTTFNNNVGLWSVAKSGNFATNTSGTNPTPKYTVTQTITGTSPSLIMNIALTGQADKAVNGPNAADFCEVPTSYTTLVTIDAPLSVTTGDALAGIGFYQSGMNGFQQYISGVSAFSLYLNPNTYESKNFVSDFTGRFYSNNYGWSQIGGSTNGVQFVNWSTAVGTSVWDGSASIPSDGSESMAKNILISDPATLTIPVGGKLSVGNIENNTANGLNIRSNASGTGSLIASTVSGSGNSVAESYLTTGRWHMLSPPLTGQSYAAFLTASGNIINIATNGSNRGMINYNTATNTWSSFYTNATSGSFSAASGYMMRTDANAAVIFSGTMNTGTRTKTLQGSGETGWNLTGNPYTSSISINNAADAVNGFMVVNAAVIDASYLGIYIWNETLGKYDVINNASATPGYASPTQAFFVRSKQNGASLTFNKTMQSHQNIALKSAQTSFPEIILKAQNNDQQASTSIRFIDGTTSGLDPGYDAGIFKGDATVSLYTRLVVDNGNLFTLQCLPGSWEKFDIPVGLDSKAGGNVVFSAETTGLPGDLLVLLEDKLSGTFTDLLAGEYTTSVEANSEGTGRFVLHTQTSTTQTDANFQAGLIRAYAFRNTEIRISGNLGDHSTADLYDIQGRKILSKTMQQGHLHILKLPDIKSGIYLLFVNDNGNLHQFKIPVNK